MDRGDRGAAGYVVHLAHVYDVNDSRQARYKTTKRQRAEGALERWREKESSVTRDSHPPGRRDVFRGLRGATGAAAWPQTSILVARAPRILRHPHRDALPMLTHFCLRPDTVHTRYLHLHMCTLLSSIICPCCPSPFFCRGDPFTTLLIQLLYKALL